MKDCAILNRSQRELLQKYCDAAVLDPKKYDVRVSKKKNLILSQDGDVILTISKHWKPGDNTADASGKKYPISKKHREFFYALPDDKKEAMAITAEYVFRLARNELMQKSNHCVNVSYRIEDDWLILFAESDTPFLTADPIRLKAASPGRLLTQIDEKISSCARQLLFYESPKLVRTAKDTLKKLFDDWVGDHPFDPKMKAALKNTEVRSYLSDSGTALMEIACGEKLLRMRKAKGSDVLNGKISVDFMGTGMKAVYDYVNDEAVLPSELTACYSRLVFASENIKMLSDIRKYIAEKGFGVTAGFAKEKTAIELQKRRYGRTHCVWFVPNGTSYKLPVRSKCKELEGLIAEWALSAEKEYRKYEWYGTYLSDAIIELISDNNDYITPSAVAKILHGNRCPGSFNRTDIYFGKFPHISTDDIKKRIDSMVKCDVLKYCERRGDYGRYNIVRVGSMAFAVIDMQKNNRHKKIEEWTEFEMLSFIRDAGNIASVSAAKRLSVIERLAGMTGMCDAHKAEVADFLNGAPDEVRLLLDGLRAFETVPSRKKLLKLLMSEI